MVSCSWVCFLDSVNEPGITDDEKEKRMEHADTVGAWLAWINVILSVVIIIISIAVD